MADDKPHGSEENPFVVSPENEADTNDSRHSKERLAKKQKQPNERAIRGANGEDASHLSNLCSMILCEHRLMILRLVANKFPKSGQCRKMFIHGSSKPDWLLRNRLINRLGSVCTEWHDIVAPAGGWAQCRKSEPLHRCVTLTAELSATNVQPWWHTVIVGRTVNVTYATFLVLAQQCAGLTTLYVSHCAITDAAILALAEHCAGLTTVHMDYCLALTDAAILALAQHCAGLTNVYMNSCRITDAAILALAKRCAGLITVHMSGCHDLTGAAIRALAEHCAGLTTVNIMSCDKITGADLLAVTEDPDCSLCHIAVTSQSAEVLGLTCETNYIQPHCWPYLWQIPTGAWP